MRTRTGDVSAPAERALLDDYFAYRAAAFPTAGGYSVTMPDPAAFEPPAGVFLVVEGDDGAAVGCGGIRMLPSPETETVRYEVKHVWIDPAARSHGWATELLLELERRALELGATELVLDTHHTLESAGRLYARLGYLPTAPYNSNPNATRWYRKPLR